jgi:hypothetical protein
MWFYKRFLINVMDYHGRAHMRSRRVTLARLLAMGV